MINILLDQKVIVKWNSSNKKVYIEKGYNFTKMGNEFNVDIKDLNIGSNELIYFKCDYCGEIKNNKTYYEYLRSRKKIQKDCCDNRNCINKKMSESYYSEKISINENLSVNFPNLIEEWDYIKNTKNPEEYKIGSNKKVWWICKICKHNWSAQINSRTNGRGCPACANQVVTDNNNLLVKFPNIAKEWHPIKNGDLKPNMITSGTAKRIWWICNQGHEWDMTVYNRTTYNHNCPYCNCLATLYPEISKEWNQEKNKDLTPYDVRAKSNKKVWWTCLRCNHEWKATIDKRTVQNRGCPVCNESKGEKSVRKFLENKNIKFKTQYEFNDLKGVGGWNLKFDFAIFDNNDCLKLLIEFDGDFHFRKVYHGDHHERTIEHDNRKNSYCKEKNIRLLRIPFWEFNNLEKILEREFTIPVQ